MKETLMIHEMNDQMKGLRLEDYLLTFDDGLYSQYHYGRHISADKIFFITPMFIKEGENDIGQKTMSIDNIKELIEMGIEIGGHSYYHTNLNSLSSLTDKVNHIRRDTALMFEWFDKELNIKPTSFCFPYNDDLNGIYKLMVDCDMFHGKGRIDINADGIFV